MTVPSVIYTRPSSRPISEDLVNYCWLRISTDEQVRNLTRRSDELPLQRQWLGAFLEDPEDFNLGYHDVDNYAINRWQEGLKNPSNIDCWNELYLGYLLWEDAYLAGVSKPFLEVRLQQYVDALNKELATNRYFLRGLVQIWADALGRGKVTVTGTRITHVYRSPIMTVKTP